MVCVDKAEFLLCSLGYGNVLQQPLDLMFTEGEEVTFFLNGNGNWLDFERLKYARKKGIYSKRDFMGNGHLGLVVCLLVYTLYCLWHRCSTLDWLPCGGPARRHGHGYGRNVWWLGWRWEIVKLVFLFIVLSIISFLHYYCSSDKTFIFEVKQSIFNFRCNE